MLRPLFTQETGEQHLKKNEGLVVEDESRFRIRFQLIFTVIGGSDCRRSRCVPDGYRTLLTEPTMDC
jgi:hypothetical protein